MPRKRRAQPATKAQRRRGLGVLIDGLTSELEEQQQLLTELQEEHCKLRSSHDILVGYCDALEFGIELERARQSRAKASCKRSSTAAAAAGSEDEFPWQGQQGSLEGELGAKEVEQQLLAQLAQLRYSAQPLGAPTDAAAGQQQQQDVEGEMACRNLSAQSNSSSTTTYPSSHTPVEGRICPPDDKFLLFRWLMAQPVSPEAEQMTPAGLSAHYSKTVQKISRVLLRLGEITPAQAQAKMSQLGQQHAALQQQQQQQQQQPVPLQIGSKQQLPLQVALLQQLQLQPMQQQQHLVSQQQSSAELRAQVKQEPDLYPTTPQQLHQVPQSQQQGTLQAPQICDRQQQPLPPPPLQQQQQQQQQVLGDLQRLMSPHIHLLLSLVRLGRGHVVSEMCMTNTHTGQLMKECCLEEFKACVRQLGLSRQQLRDISLAWSVFNSIHAPILQEVRQLQQQLGLAGLPASSSMLSHLTRCNSQSAQLDRLLLLQNKGSMLRNCFAYHMFGCMSWVQWGKLSVLLLPYPTIAPVVAQAVAAVDEEERAQAAELQRQQQQQRQEDLQQQQQQQRLRDEDFSNND